MSMFKKNELVLIPNGSGGYQVTLSSIAAVLFPLTA